MTAPSLPQESTPLDSDPPESAVLDLDDQGPRWASDHPYAAFLAAVDKPGRYIGGEHGQRRKDWDSVQCTVCLAFPDLYDIGMSHLGYRILYKLLNDDAALLAERCYTPWRDMQAELLKHGELLRSLESARPLCEFDVVGFSLQFELTYTNVLSMLHLGGIPLRSEHRTESDPLIIAGGPVATHAEPLAPFIDAFVIGDAEELAGEVAHTWAAARRERLSRREALLRVAQLSGVYVPALYEVSPDPETGLHVVQPSADPRVPQLPIQRRLVPDLSRFPFPSDGPVGGPEAIFSRVSIEVARGCTEGCRFCQAGMIYRPVRERKPSEVVEAALRALEHSGHDEVSLTALSTADVSCISPLIQKLVEQTAPERVSLSVASLRAYGLADDLLDEMRRVRAGGLTFAPEAGTQRMRDVINKNVTEEQLMETAERVFAKGFDSMKLYFMIGLPTEEDEDVVGIVQVGRNALRVADRLRRSRAKVTVSVSTHVPKPHTPFQWCALDSLPEIRRKQQLLRQALGRDRRLGLRCHDSTTSYLEGVFSRGDRRLADVMERAFERGAAFDSWDDQLRMDVWQEAFEHFNVDTERYLGTLPLSARLPWDHFDIGLEQGFLAKEYRKALQNRLSPPCGKAAGMFIHHTNVSDASTDERRLVCYDCGVACDMTRMRSERIGFLSEMGALEPGVKRRRLPIAEGTEPEPEPETSPRHPSALERERPRQPGVRHERWRLTFQKLGPAALIGHLDLMKELSRVIRRAGLRPVYSQGFHPKPRMSFGPALALGVASLDEKIDVDLIDPPGSDTTLLQQLNAVTSSGLAFVSAERFAADTITLGSAIDGARYLLVFAASAIPQDVLATKIAEFLQREKSTIRRTSKGIGRLIDVRARVRDLRLGDATDRARAAAAGIVGRVTCVVADVELGPAGSVKPSEIVEAVLGDASAPHQVVRDVMLLATATPSKRRVTEQDVAAELLALEQPVASVGSPSAVS
ncbi:MAG: hypothetical protein RL685_4810 [Pseudomonadota bacterium]|jgi:radical SAM family uncharacterized protein/radical SAM-linked protein